MIRNLLLLALSILPAKATFTYVDATLENTTLAVAPLTQEAPANYFPGTGTGTDGLWSFRSLSGYEGDGSHFESDSGTGSEGANDREATPDLVTSLTLPTAGTYRIVVIFTRSNNRDIAAKMGGSPGETEIFTHANALNVDKTSPSAAITFDAFYQNGRGPKSGGADLGTVTTTGVDQTIEIHINGLASTAALDDERTQYDGVAYELVSPTGPVHRDVFIIAGQSNADGRGAASGLTGLLSAYAGPQPDVLIHYTNPAFNVANDPLYQKWTVLHPGFSVAPGSSGALPRGTFGMEVGAGTILSGHYPHPAIIKVTQGGTALAHVGFEWYPPIPNPASTGPLYNALIASTQQALRELTAAGDTYTVHAFFWHQGESDHSRESAYADTLTDFISSVRRDLGLPNLRFLIGELAAAKPQSFRDIQWQVSRDVSNVGFVSSRNLTTRDADTHFDTPSAVNYGLRVGEMFVGNSRMIDFESPTYTTGGLDRQDNFSASSAIVISNTASSGEYPGGQAAGNLSSTGGFSAQRDGLPPLADARVLRADLVAAKADSEVFVAGWASDANANGGFDSAESGIAMGLGSDGLFHLRSGSTDFPAVGFSYQAGHWYQLKAVWTAPDAAGMSQVTLTVRDRTSAHDINGVAPVVTASVSHVDTATWLGLGLRTDRGQVDNIEVEAPGYAGWKENRYPGLSGSSD